MVRVTFIEPRPFDDTESCMICSRVEEFQYEFETVSYRVLEYMFSAMEDNEALVTVMVGTTTTYVAVVVEAKLR